VVGAPAGGAGLGSGVIDAGTIAGGGLSSADLAAGADATLGPLTQGVDAAAPGFDIGATDLGGLQGGFGGLEGAGSGTLPGAAPGFFSNLMSSPMSTLQGLFSSGADPADPNQVVGDIAAETQGGASPSTVATAENALAGGSGPPAASATSSAGALASKGLSTTSLALGALAGLGSLLSKPKAVAPPGPSSTAATQGPVFNANLNPTGFINRTPLNPLPGSATQTQGGGPEQLYFAGNQLQNLGAPVPAARGGHMVRGALYARGGALAPPVFATDGGQNYVQGPGDGTSDDVDAKLSNGEYVMTARDVSALGRGSNEAGARVLDEMRRRLHQDTGSKKVIAPQGKKGPLEYMREARGSLAA
jgi:hypothetical protein